MDIEKILFGLFDYQRFDPNPKLEHMIGSVRSRYLRHPLMENELERVAAAGEPFARELEQKERNVEA